MTDTQLDDIARIIDPEAWENFDDAYARKDRLDMMAWIGRLNTSRARAEAIFKILGFK